MWEDKEVYEAIAKLVGVMRERNIRQREAGIDNATGNYIAVVIDEMATFAAKPSTDAKNPLNKAHAAFVDDLTKLAMRGRSTGLRLIVSAQSPVAHRPFPCAPTARPSLPFAHPSMPTPQHSSANSMICPPIRVSSPEAARS